MRQLLTVAAAVALVAAGYVLGRQAAADGPAAGPKRKVLLEQAVPAQLEGKDARVTLLELEYPPGGRNASHRHPCPVVVYVLEGELESQVEGQPVRVYKKGEVFYEAPGRAHLVSHNPSKTRPARFLAFFLTARDQKNLVIPERP
jgi:quercetin dioxygenase-like cupin family protein